MFWLLIPGGFLKVISGRRTGRPSEELLDPLANSRFVLAQDRALTPEEVRQHLLALHDAVSEEAGERGVFDRMALRMALELYARAIDAKDLIAAARALSEFIRAMGRLRLLETARGVARKPVPTARDGQGRPVPTARSTRTTDDDEEDDEQEAGDDPAETECDA